MLSSILFSALALLAVSISPASAQTNLLVNGDFETCTSNQATATQNGLGQVAWFPYAGRADAVANGGVGIGFHGNAGVKGPNFASYSNYCSYDFESEDKMLGITQQVAVTAGTQYVLSFFIQMANIDKGVQFTASYQWNDGSAATTLMTQSAFPAIPFYWTQFKFPMTPPTGASAVNITFAGQDYDYGIMLDYATLWAGALSAAPPAPSAIPANPSNNLLINGDFESGAMAPWTSTMATDPYDMYSGGGAYAFLATPDWGVNCTQGRACAYLGAYTPYTLTTTVTNLTVGTNYQLSFQWVNNGGYQASNANDTGSSLAVYYGYGGSATTLGWKDAGNSSSPVGSITSPMTQTISMGAATATSVSLAITAYNYQTNYIVDYIQLTTGGGSGKNGASAASAGMIVAAAAVAVSASLLL